MKHPRLSTAATLLAALAALIFALVAAATLTACTPTPRIVEHTLIRRDTVRITTHDTLRRAAIVDARQVREHSPSLLQRIGHAALRWVLAPLGVLALAAILALLGRALIRRLLARP